jgi:hypothetical protein
MYNHVTLLNMKRNNLYINLISLRVKVSIFVLSPEIEDRGQVEVNNWAKLRKIFYSTGCPRNARQKFNHELLAQKIKLHLIFEVHFFFISFSLLRCPTTS